METMTFKEIVDIYGIFPIEGSPQPINEPSDLFTWIQDLPTYTPPQPYADIQIPWPTYQEYNQEFNTYEYIIEHSEHQMIYTYDDLKEMAESQKYLSYYPQDGNGNQIFYYTSTGGGA